MTSLKTLLFPLALVLSLASLAFPAPAQTNFFSGTDSPTKETAAPAFGMVAGDSLSGPCFGAGFNFFHIKLEPQPPAIYRHELQSFSATAALWGRDALPDTVIAGSYAELQPSSTFLAWYGFGRGEELFVDVNNSGFCRFPSFSVLSTETVTPDDLGALPANSNGITAVTVRAASDDITEAPAWQVYDAELRALPGHTADDPGSALNGVEVKSYVLSPGTYFLGVAANEIATHLPLGYGNWLSPVTDFLGPTVAYDETPGSRISLDVGVFGGGMLSTPPIATTRRHELLWYRFTLGAAETNIAFCTGDGSAAPCPCGVDGPAGSKGGCPGSSGRGATAVSWLRGGSPFGRVVSFHDLPAGAAMLPFASIQLQGPVAASAGLMCLGAPAHRLGLIQADPAGDAELVIDMAAIPGAMMGQPLYVQAAYRDPAAPAGCQINLTSGTGFQL